MSFLMEGRWRLQSPSLKALINSRRMSKRSRQDTQNFNNLPLSERRNNMYFQTAPQLWKKNFHRISAGTRLCKRCCATFEDFITCHLPRTSSHCASPLSRSGILTTPVSSEPRIQACVGEQHGCISILPVLPILNLPRSPGTLEYSTWSKATTIELSFRFSLISNDWQSTSNTVDMLAAGVSIVGRYLMLFFDTR